MQTQQEGLLLLLPILLLLLGRGGLGIPRAKPVMGKVPMVTAGRALIVAVLGKEKAAKMRGRQAGKGFLMERTGKGVGKEAALRRRRRKIIMIDLVPVVGSRPLTDSRPLRRNRVRRWRVARAKLMALLQMLQIDIRDGQAKVVSGPLWSATSTCDQFFSRCALSAEPRKRSIKQTFQSSAAHILERPTMPCATGKTRSMPTKITDFSHRGEGRRVKRTVAAPATGASVVLGRDSSVPLKSTAQDASDKVISAQRQGAGAEPARGAGAPTARRQQKFDRVFGERDAAKVLADDSHLPAYRRTNV